MTTSINNDKGVLINPNDVGYRVKNEKVSSTVLKNNYQKVKNLHQKHNYSNKVRAMP
jgi:hypothetical protein